MKRTLIIFLSLVSIGITSNAQNATCSEKMETLGLVMASETKIRRLSNRSHITAKRAEAQLALSQTIADRRLNGAAIQPRISS